jgi:uncharacterized protein (UPF0333 family)
MDMTASSDDDVIAIYKKIKWRRWNWKSWVTRFIRNVSEPENIPLILKMVVLLVSAEWLGGESRVN